MGGGCSSFRWGSSETETVQHHPCLIQGAREAATWPFLPSSAAQRQLAANLANVQGREHSLGGDIDLEGFPAARPIAVHRRG